MINFYDHKRLGKNHEHIFYYLEDADPKKQARKLYVKKHKIIRKENFMIFKQTCINNKSLPKYSLYIYIYIYIFVCVCVRACNNLT